MDDVDSKDFETKDFGSEELDEMSVYGDGSAVSPEIEPIPFDDSETSGTEVSHSPLNLGSGDAVEMADVGVTTPEDKVISLSDRITGVKTFFTKLHPGAIDFLDTQITNWLKNNPGVAIRRVNTTTGEIQSKKTEPNIIITVWY